MCDYERDYDLEKGQYPTRGKYGFATKCYCYTMRQPTYLEGLVNHMYLHSAHCFGHKIGWWMLTETAKEIVKHGVPLSPAVSIILLKACWGDSCVPRGIPWDHGKEELTVKQRERVNCWQKVHHQDYTVCNIVSVILDFYKMADIVKQKVMEKVLYHCEKVRENEALLENVKRRNARAVLYGDEAYSAYDSGNDEYSDPEPFYLRYRMGIRHTIAELFNIDLWASLHLLLFERDYDGQDFPKQWRVLRCPMCFREQNDRELSINFTTNYNHKLKFRCFNVRQPTTSAELAEHVFERSHQCIHHKILWYVLVETAVQIHKTGIIHSVLVNLLLEKACWGRVGWPQLMQELDEEGEEESATDISM